jgi:hypothetical protein
MSHVEVMVEWEEILRKYDLEFIKKAIHSYERSQEYHRIRNERINRVIKLAKENGTF